MTKEIKHSICFRCKPRCVLDLEVEDNQIVNVSTSSIKKCPRKWASDLERFYHPDRLNYPLKREISAKLQALKDQYGAETLGVTAGTSRTYEELNSRFLNLFGSPNQCGQAQICHGNSAVVATTLFGWWPYWMHIEKLQNQKKRRQIDCHRSPPFGISRGGGFMASAAPGYRLRPAAGYDQCDNRRKPLR
jgi:anaerobic selenocysteine-containing dehydrogenase